MISSSSERFEFGENWRNFLQSFGDAQLTSAERSLREMLGVSDLKGKRFLDIGSGSGLSSLCARRLGARVHSFDYDGSSVRCTNELRFRYFPTDPDWTVERGDVLARDYLARLGIFDVVYTWGVLHHTGEMWKALENVVPLVRLGGSLFLAIYNDQGGPSRVWATVKRAYNRLPPRARFLVLYPSFLRLWGPTMVRDFVRGAPFWTWRKYDHPRGMSPWNDVVDWVGGYPFEVARPDEIFEFYRARDFSLEKLRTCGGGHGCNEYLFTKMRTD